MTQPPTPHHGSAASEEIIIVNALGRGGSSLIWYMIGSSPDVIMTTKEWHLGVFGDRKMLRKMVTTAFHQLGIRTAPAVARFFRNRTLATLCAEDLARKPAARCIVVKVMDHHIVYSDLIARGFPSARQVVLRRHPILHCESLIRSGLSRRQACKWFNDVAALMIERCSQPAALVYSFEDLVTDPMDFCDRLYADLGIRWSDDRTFLAKDKPFGEARQSDLDVSQASKIRVGADNVRRLIRSDAIAKAQARLSNEDRAFVWRETGALATRLGYREAVCAPGQLDDRS